VFEFREHKKGSVLAVQGFVESEAVNTLARRERGRFIRKPEGLDLAAAYKTRKYLCS
jgi:hypothetical protein